MKRGHHEVAVTALGVIVSTLATVPAGVIIHEVVKIIRRPKPKKND